MHLFHRIAIGAVLLIQVATGAKLNFMTRNLALHNSTTSYAPRLDRLTTMIEEFRASDADGICLQEVWYSNDLEQIITELNSEYPYSFSSLHGSDGELIPISAEQYCSAKGLGELLLCIDRNCPNASSVPDAFSCAATLCQARLYTLPSLCWLCVLLSDRLDYQGECVTTANFTINIGGLLYLSKRKIVEAAFKPFDVSDGVDFTDIKNGRGHLKMAIKGIGGVVACTHLVEAHDTLPFIEPALPQYKSYEDMNLGQVSQLMKTLVHDQVILMGSFGTGPKYKNRVLAEFPQSYKMIKTAKPTFKRSSVKKCTKCDDDTVTDHIFVLGHKLLSSRRAFVNQLQTDHCSMGALVRTVSLRD